MCHVTVLSSSFETLLVCQSHKLYVMGRPSASGLSVSVFGSSACLSRIHPEVNLTVFMLILTKLHIVEENMPSSSQTVLLPLHSHLNCIMLDFQVNIFPDPLTYFFLYHRVHLIDDLSYEDVKKCYRGSVSTRWHTVQNHFVQPINTVTRKTVWHSTIFKKVWM